MGDSWFIGLELRTEVFLAAGYYASMGFAVPGALGAGIADRSRRPLAIVGDGAFQMTGTELATMVDQGLRPIVLLLNNLGYGMLEAIDRPCGYYARRGWDYPSMARALGATAERVTTAAELHAAMRRAEADPGAWLIEAVTARDDLSPVMARIRGPCPPGVKAGAQRPDFSKGIPRPMLLVSVRPRILRDVLDRDKSGELLAAGGCRGELPEGDGVKVAEDMLRPWRARRARILQTTRSRAGRAPQPEWPT